MRLILLIALMFCSCIGVGQNLVPNPSFEDTLGIPLWNGTLEQSCSDWKTPGPGTTDYYNDLNPLCIGCASLVHSARSGISYAGIYTYKQVWQVNAREILTVQLLDTLQAGKTYSVNYFVCRGYFPNYSCDNIGAYFSSQPITSSNGVTSYTAQIQNPITNSLANKVDWVQISGVFTANGDELFLTIGNFVPDSLSDLTFEGDGYLGDSSAYYFVDDVSVIQYVEPLDTIFSFVLYPNPNDGEFFISGTFQTDTEMKIFNVLGQEVCDPLLIPEGSHRVPLLVDLAPGTYIFRLATLGVVIEKGRFVVY